MYGFSNTQEPQEWMWKFVLGFGIVFGICMFVLNKSPAQRL